MTFRVLAAAEVEILEAACWYDNQHPKLGDQFLQDVADAFERIHREPLLFGRLGDYTPDRDDVRRWLLHRFPYIVVYRHRPDETVVAAVSHVRRKTFYWLQRMP